VSAADTSSSSAPVAGAADVGVGVGDEHRHRRGIASTLIFAGSTLPMVVRAARTRDVSPYSRSQLFMTNTGNAVHTVYIASLSPGPVWLLHCMYSFVTAFMFAAHVRWAPHPTAGLGPGSPVAHRLHHATR